MVETFLSKIFNTFTNRRSISQVMKDKKTGVIVIVHKCENKIYVLSAFVFYLPKQSDVCPGIYVDYLCTDDKLTFRKLLKIEPSKKRKSQTRITFVLNKLVNHLLEKFEVMVLVKN